MAKITPLIVVMVSQRSVRSETRPLISFCQRVSSHMMSLANKLKPANTRKNKLPKHKVIVISCLFVGARFPWPYKLSFRSSAQSLRRTLVGNIIHLFIVPAHLVLQHLFDLL